MARLVLAALCVGSLGAVSVAGERPPLLPSREGVERDRRKRGPKEGGDAYAELRDLLEAAPNRQVGQPGNAAVDRVVAERFAEAVRSHNDPEAWRRAGRLVDEADRAERALSEAQQRSQVLSREFVSHVLVRMTLEKPWVAAGLLVCAVAVLGATWWVRRKGESARRSLLTAAAVVLGIAILLPVAALVVETRAERADAEGSLRRAVVGAARRALEADIEAARALRGLWQCGRITFPSAAFVPGRAWLVVEEGGREGRRQKVRLYQMSPNLVEPANLMANGRLASGRALGSAPLTSRSRASGRANSEAGEAEDSLRGRAAVSIGESGYEGSLTYAGMARPRDLAGRELEGAAVLLDFDSGNRWLDVAQLGAEVVIVLEPPKGSPATFSQAAQKITTSPLSIPRYYVKREDFAAAFGEGWLEKRRVVGTTSWTRLRRGTVKVSIRGEPGRWRYVELSADWLFVPGTAESKQADTPLPEDPSRQILHIQAYKDSASIVPEVSPGASAAANLVLLLRLLERFGEGPKRRPVLLSVVNDHCNALNGEQEYAFAAFAEPRAVREEIGHIDRELARQRLIAGVFGRPRCRATSEGPDAARPPTPEHAAPRLRSSGWPPAPEFMEELRHRLETIGGRVFTVKEPVVERLQRLCNAAREKRNTLIMQLEQAAPRGGDNVVDPTAPGARSVIKSPGEREELRLRIEEVWRETEDLVALSGLFNRLGTKTYLQELEPYRQEKCRKLFEEVAAQARLEAASLEGARRRLTDNLALRRRLLALAAPGGLLSSEELEDLPDDLPDVLDRRYAPLPAVAVLTLDLSFGSGAAGFFYHGYLGRFDQSDQFVRHARERTSVLARHTLGVAAEYEASAGRSGGGGRLADTIRYAGGMPWQGHLGGRFALGSRAAHQYAVAGLTLTSVRDSRPRAFTPHDTLDRLDREHFDSLMEFAEGYFPMLADSPLLGHTLRSRGDPRTLSVEISIRKQDKFSVAVPKTRLSGALLLAAADRLGLQRLRPMFGQVRPWPVLMSDVRGTVTLRGSVWDRASLQAFAYDPDGARGGSPLVGALDLGRGEKRFASTLWIPKTTVFDSRSVVTFDARKVDLIGLTEPLTLTPATSIDVIDAYQDGTPRHYSVSGVLSVALPGKRVPLAADGSGSIFIEPDRRFKLRVGTGLVINATREDPQGEGFPAGIGRLRNVVLTSATDMWRLTDSRLELLSKKGVTDETAIALKDAAGRSLDAVGASRLAGRGDLVQVGAEEARGLAYRTYARALSTTNDLIKAVVILLGLVIPFCFFAMKLVTPFTDVNRQLAMFVAIFVLMAAVLHSVHPAFEVARTPQVVILAFVILGLAVFVASILIGRFNSSMTQAVEESEGSTSVDAPQSRLLGVAFMVGVNNMKRRRIRTTLTTATILLVTFTMLSVISVGRDVEPVRLRLSADAPYDGFVYANPGVGPIDSIRIQRLRAHLADRTASVARVWSERKGSYGEYFPVELRTGSTPLSAEAAAEALTVKVVLGLEKAEDGFLGPMPVLPGGRWFSSDEAPELLLSEKAAALVGITPEDLGAGPTRPFWLRGRRVELVGLLDDEQIESMRDAADLPVLPLLTEASQQKGQLSRARASESSAAALAEAGGLADLPGLEVARAQEVAFVPAGFALSFGDATFRSLSVKYWSLSGEEPDAVAHRVWEDVSALMRFQDVRVFASLAHPVLKPEEDLKLDVGQYALISSSTAEVGGVLKVAIPIVLAATIILNTMLGSVMERRREIAIYNAIGLNPTHVMVFFLAESIVFGLVGSIAGYMVGQILSLVLSRFIELNLNYSSLSVMLVIFLAIGTVLASTVYPAMMAARAAVPSGQRRWSLPQPEGDEIHVKFPFSYDRERAMGVCAYLREFMRQNSEASTGKFLAKLGPVGVVPPSEGGRAASGPSDVAASSGQRRRPDQARHRGENAYAMIFDIAPAPFDLGVNQKMEVYAYYDPHVRAHMLSVHLRRLSGEKSNWVTVNQPFLEALRKRLLGWRSQRQETQEEYYRRGQELFRGASELPVVLE